MRDYENATDKNFIRIPNSIKTWFLDTCVWGAIVSSETNLNNFVNFLVNNNYLAGLTTYTLFELSRAKSKIRKLDKLFYKMRHNIWIAQLYDSLFEAELANYPNKPDIRWMPMSSLTGEIEGMVNVMSKFADDPLFVNSRNEHLNFGKSRFMSLEDFKRNFPKLDKENYTTSQVKSFSLCNGISYFLNHEINTIKEIGPRNFIPEGIPSQFIRSLFLFYKYYIHGQSPGESDFFDFAHVSYSPYFDFYVAEKNASNVLKHIKSTGMSLQKTEIINFTEFMKIIRQG